MISGFLYGLNANKWIKRSLKTEMYHYELYGKKIVVVAYFKGLRAISGIKGFGRVLLTWLLPRPLDKPLEWNGPSLTVGFDGTLFG